MKILIISQYFYPENFKINDIAISLVQKGHEVEVLTGTPNYPFGDFYNGFKFWSNNDGFYEGIKIHRAKLIPRKKGGKIMLSLNYLSFVFFGFFKLLTIKSDFDRILTFAPSPITVGILGSLASIKYNAKTLLWVQDLWPESVKVAGGVKNTLILNLLDFLTRNIYHFTDLILIQSEFFKNYIKNQNVDHDKIYYLPNYAEEFYKPLDSDEVIKRSFGDEFSVLFAGNIGEAQNLKILVDAARILKDQKYKVKFIIIGEGRFKSDLRLYIDKLDLNNFFTFLGYIEPTQIPKYFASADSLYISLKPAQIFSLTIPSKLQTYMACGRPIIASIGGVTAKIIKESNCGFNSKPGDSKLLAKNIIKMLKLSNKEKIVMSTNALKYYKKNFDKKIIMNKLETLLNQ